MIKDIAVHLAGTDEDESRLAHATAIAASFEAHITALHIHEMPELIASIDPVGAGYMQPMITEAQGRGQRVHEALRQRLSALPLPHDLRRLDLYPGQTAEALAAEVRTTDLFVGTLPYARRDRSGHIEEAVLFKSGRGCLFVPPAAPARERHGSVFIAWKNNREAARAVAEALPFLERATRVTIGIVEEDGAGGPTDRAGSRLVRYLGRHGIAAELQSFTTRGDIGEALLHEAGEAGAELLVMGGYGHSRFREWILGGATRHVLTQAEVPVLTAH